METMTDHFGPPKSIYTKEDAVEDGSQAFLGKVDDICIYMTSTLIYDGFEQEQNRDELIHQGLLALAMPDSEDTPYMKLRVLVTAKIWVIQAPDGITFMKPEDY